MLPIVAARIFRWWLRLQFVLLSAGVLALALLLLNGAFVHRMSETVPFDLYEMLISYQGGFVRRGLIGELFFHIPFLVGLDRIEVAVKVFCLAVFGCAFALLALWVWRCTKSVSSTLLITLQPFLFGFPLLSYEWLRKDTLLVAAYFLVLHLLRNRLTPHTRPNSLLAWNTLLINLVSAAAVLSHEAYGIAMVPVLILVAASQRYGTGSPLLLSTARSVAEFAPSLLLVVFVSFHRGDPAVGLRIAEAWSARGLASGPWALAYRFVFSPGPDAMLGVSYVARFARMRGWLHYLPWLSYWPGVWLCSGALLIVGSTLVEPGETGRSPKQAATVAVVTALAFLPLFVMAIDWGRWIYLWSCTIAGILYTPAKHEVFSFVNAIHSRLRRSGVREAHISRPFCVPRSLATGLLVASLFFFPLTTIMTESCCNATNIVRWCLAYRIALRAHLVNPAETVPFSESNERD